MFFVSHDSKNEENRQIGVRPKRSVGMVDKLLDEEESRHHNHKVCLYP